MSSQARNKMVDIEQKNLSKIFFKRVILRSQILPKLWILSK
jgi:hypothetical protein